MDIDFNDGEDQDLLSQMIVSRLADSYWLGEITAGHWTTVDPRERFSCPAQQDKANLTLKWWAVLETSTIKIFFFFFTFIWFVIFFPLSHHSKNRAVNCWTGVKNICGDVCLNFLVRMVVNGSLKIALLNTGVRLIIIKSYAKVMKELM